MSTRHLVFIHGFLEDASMWKYLLPLLSKKDYNIHLPELPGHGSNVSIPSERTADSYCRNILEQLPLDKESTVFVIAHSMGGYLASRLVQMIPGQVRGLCLFHSKAGADGEQKIADRKRAIEAARENKDLYVRTMINSTFATRNHSHCAESIEKMIASAKQLSFETIEASQTVMMSRPDNVEALRSRDFPLYYFLGDQDLSLLLELVLKESEELPGSVAYVAEGIGHMGHIECTREAAAFLQRILRADF